MAKKSEFRCTAMKTRRPDRNDETLPTSAQVNTKGSRRNCQIPPGFPTTGQPSFNARSGATAVGARDFLVAYNVNLNTTSTRRANAIAFDVREKGRMKRSGHPLTGEVIRDKDGEPEWDAGSLKSVKAIGWYIEEYGVAQISMNLTNISVTPVHVAFDECVERARDRGIRVTGSELVGLIPLASMLNAGRHYLKKQQRSTGVSDAELIKIATKSMGLDELGPFDPTTNIIEYVLADKDNEHRLIDRSVKEFVEETASESPAPGGGSVAATLGALGAALATMVANLSSHRRGWDDRWEEFSNWAERGKVCHDELLRLVDEDTNAFNAILDAFRLPKATHAEETDRTAAIQSATRRAIEVPFRVMVVAYESMETIAAMAEFGQETSASDAGVAALCARSAVIGAYLNVRINAADLKDTEAAAAFIARGGAIEKQAIAAETAILALVDKKL